MTPFFFCFYFIRCHLVCQFCVLNPGDIIGIVFSLALGATAEAGPDIDDYVTDGLVAFYDATYHSEDGNTWYDASGNNKDIDLSTYDKTKNYFDDAKGVFVNSATKVNFDSSIADVITSSKFTTEMVVKDTEVLGTTWGTYLNCASDDYSLFIRLGSPIYVEFKCGSNWDRPKEEVASKDAFKDCTVTVTYDKDAGMAKIYINGELYAEKANTAVLNGTTFFFGHDDVQKSHNTEFAGFRFYDRALTAEEVAQNYAADNGSDLPIDLSDETSEETSQAPVSGFGENIAGGKTYTTTGVTPRGDGWDDAGTKLTDGVKVRDNSGGTSIAGLKGTNVEVVLDLGEEKEISGFMADAFGNSPWGIQSPTNITVEFLYSSDGQDFTSAGTVNGADLTPVFSEENGWEIYEFVKAEECEARYIKVIYTQPGTVDSHLWISEIEVYAPAEEVAESSQVEETSETSSGGSTPTGDSGLIALSIIAVLTLAGVVVIKRK